MMTDSFVHLHVHSSYSLSEGAIKAEKIPALAKEAGMPAVALTDTNNMFGSLEFALAATGKGVQPIMGCQLALSRKDWDERQDAERMAPAPLVALARTPEGLDNLQRLSSHSYLRDDPSGRPSITLDLLGQHARGLVLMTGGTLGPVARLASEGRPEPARRLAARLHEIFGDDLAIQIERQGMAAEAASEPLLLDLADSYNLPVVAANDIYFAKASTHAAHDALLCIAEGRLVSDGDRRTVSPESWFKPAAEMRRLFGDLPEACDNTLLIARRCSTMCEVRKPALPICPKVRPGASEGETVQEMAREGLERRLDAMGADAATRERYRERLAYELGIIQKMGFSGYFLIVADFIQWAKNHNIPVGPGRGSGAGSLAAYALLITDLDPMRFGLLFERFLNPERVSMPDFDIDFCQDRRDEVINYVRNEYGADRVAQIITFGKLQARAVVKDVGRVLGLPFGQMNRISEMIPNNPANPVTLQQAIDGEPRLQEMRSSDETMARLFDTALQLEGLYRNASTHAAGVVIGRQKLLETLPLYRDPKSEMLVTQYSMKYVEQATLVKFDFLGLKTLTVLKRGVDLLAERGVNVDLGAIPIDDKKTYDMLARGDAAGVFQFESQGMRDVLRQMRVDRFEDLIAAVALYRPGPMANIPDYCARKKGAEWESPHPTIRSILEETFGIMVYQEQVMQIAQVLAGYSLGAADLLRRAMGKKIREEMVKQRKIFCEGAMANGVEADNAGEIFDIMEKFADYGFNKSHAAAYALVSYQTAWMKANHPHAFLAASMSLDMDKTDKLANHMAEAARLGIKVLPPDINRSASDFRLEDQEDGSVAIRYALGAVKKVGEQAMRDLARERDRGGRFKSLADLANRVDPKLLNKMQIENLAKAGAFDGIETSRAMVHANADVIIRRAQAAATERSSAQIGLFGSDPGRPEPLRMKATTAWTDLERLAMEAEAIGFHLTAHPLDAYKSVLRNLKTIPLGRLEERAQAVGRVKVAGTVVAVREITTKKGSRMAFVRISDPTGNCEVTCFSETLTRSRDILSEGKAVVFSVDLKIESEAIRITANDCESLDRAAASAGAGMKIWIERVEVVEHVKQMLMREGRGKGSVSVVAKTTSTQEIEIALPGGFNVSPRIMQALKVIPGVSAVEEV